MGLARGLGAETHRHWTERIPREAAEGLRLRHPRPRACRHIPVCPATPCTLPRAQHGGARAEIALAVNEAAFCAVNSGLRPGGKLVMSALPAHGTSSSRSSPPC